VLPKQLTGAIQTTSRKNLGRADLRFALPSLSRGIAQPVKMSGSSVGDSL